MVGLGRFARIWCCSISAFAIVVVSVGCRIGSWADHTASVQGSRFKADMVRLRADLRELTLYPHPFGSARQKQLATWLAAKVIDQGWSARLDAFQADVPNPGHRSGAPSPKTLTLSGANVVALLPGQRADDCVVLVGSHYDTKRLPGLDYVGANDSGSSSALLLQLAAHWASGSPLPSTYQCRIGLVWFDGEEAYLAEWNDGLRHPASMVDNTYGSRHFVDTLVSCNGRRCLAGTNTFVAALVLVDMIGMPGVTITPEAHSTPELSRRLLAGAKTLGLSDLISGRSMPIEDDHIPFLRAGIPAINLIDFEHRSTWHRAGDTLESLSLASIEQVGQLVVWLVESIARQPPKP